MNFYSLEDINKALDNKTIDISNMLVKRKNSFRKVTLNKKSYILSAMMTPFVFVPIAFLYLFLLSPSILLFGFPDNAFVFLAICSYMSSLFMISELDYQNTKRMVYKKKNEYKAAKHLVDSNIRVKKMLDYYNSPSTTYNEKQVVNKVFAGMSIVRNVKATIEKTHSTMSYVNTNYMPKSSNTNSSYPRGEDLHVLVGNKDDGSSDVQDIVISRRAS